MIGMFAGSFVLRISTKFFSSAGVVCVVSIDVAAVVDSSVELVVVIVVQSYVGHGQPLGHSA